MYCAYCGSKLHPTGYCPHTAGGQSKRLHLRCAYCGKSDHDVEACTRVATIKWAGRGVRLLDKGRI